DFSDMVSSDLPEFFANWGVKYDPNLVIADNQLGRRVNNQALLTLVDYFQDNCNKENVALAQLNHLTMVFGGALSLAPQSKNQITADYLLSSSADAMLVPSNDAPDVSKIMAQFKSANNNFASIMHLRGKFPATFHKNSVANAKDASVIILADSDLFYDQVVIQDVKQNDRNVRRILNDNLILLNNLIELQANKNELIDIRSRQVTARPLSRFIKMQADADRKFKDKILAKHQELTQATEAYQAMAALEKEKNVIISREQREAYEFAQRTQMRLISEIKEATRELHYDVQHTKNLVKYYCIALVPLIVLALGIIVMIIKNWRSRAR
ncbi:MAG: Gldg family protein, partial [Lentisphaeria bacterium]